MKKIISAGAAKILNRARIHDFLERNRVQLIHGGSEFFELLEELIDSATHSIHLQTYIFENDQTGNQIGNALIRAAERKVAVYLLVDGFASQHLKGAFRQGLENAGVKFRFFEPFFRSKQFYFGRRLHHKVVVIDGIKALVGSMNIADRYNDVPPGSAWFDIALYTEGETASVLYHVCWELWRKRKKQQQLPPGVEEFILKIPPEKYCPVRVRRNDWIKGMDHATRTYYELLRSSKKRISIVCSYFLPNKRMRILLTRARKRGVEVRVVLAGTSDIITAKYAERYLYRWMLRHKIEVYEYQPTVLHAKMAVVDGEWLTIGSYNINGLSAYASVELNLDVKNMIFARNLESEIDELIEKNCRVIDTSTFKIRLFSLRQLFQWGAYQFLRIMVRIATFNYRIKE